MAGWPYAWLYMAGHMTGHMAGHTAGHVASHVACHTADQRPAMWLAIWLGHGWSWPAMAGVRCWAINHLITLLYVTICINELRLHNLHNLGKAISGDGFDSLQLG